MVCDVNSGHPPPPAPSGSAPAELEFFPIPELTSTNSFVGTDVISFLSTPPVLREDDEVVTILVGVQDIDGGFNSGTVAMLTIQDISEGTYHKSFVQLNCINSGLTHWACIADLQMLLLCNNVY